MAKDPIPKSKAGPHPAVNIGEPSDIRKPAMPKDYVKAGNPNDPNAGGVKKPGNTAIEQGNVSKPNNNGPMNVKPPGTNDMPDVVRQPNNPAVLILDEELFDYMLGPVGKNPLHTR